MSDSDLRTFEDAKAWLATHIDELEVAPIRIHDSAIGDKDALGALRFSGAFWAVLTGSPFATRWASENRACPEPHHGPPHPICPRCEDQYAYRVDVEEYVHPLAAAVASIRKLPSPAPTWPSPHTLVVVLLHHGLDLETSAAAVGHPILSPDHRITVAAQFLAAVRKVHANWTKQVYRPANRPNWLEKSDAQRAAEDRAA